MILKKAEGNAIKNKKRQWPSHDYDSTAKVIKCQVPENEAELTTASSSSVLSAWLIPSFQMIFLPFFLSNVYYSSNLLSPLTVGELSLCTDISLLTQPLRLTYMIQIFLLYTNLNALHFGDLQFQHVTNQSRIFFSWHTFFAGDIISFLNWQTCNSDRYPTNHVWGRGGNCYLRGYILTVCVWSWGHFKWLSFSKWPLSQRTS